MTYAKYAVLYNKKYVKISAINDLLLRFGYRNIEDLDFPNKLIVCSWTELTLPELPERPLIIKKYTGRFINFRIKQTNKVTTASQGYSVFVLYEFTTRSFGGLEITKLEDYWNFYWPSSVIGPFKDQLSKELNDEYVKLLII